LAGHLDRWMLAEQLGIADLTAPVVSGIVGAKVKGRAVEGELFEQIRRDRQAAGCRSGT
jgi:hypothetical protein